ncbi:MAG: MFS transporter [Alphaproteobacteria bacterium]|nr:MFS transporter [Alphaproteobacteria bacterium]
MRQSIVQACSGRFFYGWIIVFVGSFGVFSSGPGQSHTFSVFLDPIGTELGISSASMATAYGLATLAAAFMLPQMGRLIDRWGPRKGLLLIVLALGAACFFFGAAANFLWLAVGFAFMRFFGQGSLMMGCANMVSHWFTLNRGLAMSLMALGFGASMAVHPPLSQYLVNEIGWRNAWFAMGLITWITMVPPLLLLVFDKPEDVGLRPDGEAPAKATDEADGTEEISGLTLSEALRTPTFYILALVWFAIAMLVTTLHFYQVKVVTDQGLSKEEAASLFTVSALTMVCMMPVVGRMFDKLRTRYVVALALVVTALNLAGITFVTSYATGIVYALMFGLNNALSMTMFGYIWPRYFGRKHLGSIQGTGQMVGVFGASLGPLPVGLAYDLVGNATATLQALAIFPAAAAILSLLFLRAPANLTESAHLE